jgi:hypothetical protein
VSSAHVPPEAVGGKPLTFSCRACNSFLGTAFEASAIDYLRRAPERATGRRVTKVRFGPKGGPLSYSRAVIDVDEHGNKSISMDPLGRMNEYVTAAFKNHGGNFTIQFEEESPRPTRLAFLSWGFLTLFAKFGYSYVLSGSSRIVRASLFEREERFGETYFLQSSELPSPLPPPTVSVVVERDDVGSARLVSLGMSLGPAVVVCLPLASDHNADRIRELFDDTTTGPNPRGDVVPLPFEQLYEMARNRTFLDESWRFQHLDGAAALTVVGASRDEATAALADAHVPIARRRTGPRKSVSDTAWKKKLPRLPANVAASEWIGVVTSDLRSRLSEASASASVARSLEMLATASSPEEFSRLADAHLDAHLARHVRDYYRLFVGSDVSIGDEDHRLDWVAASSMFRAIAGAAGYEKQVALGFDSESLDQQFKIAQHSAFVGVDGHDILIGPYYAVETALLAAQVTLPPWLDALDVAPDA